MNPSETTAQHALANTSALNKPAQNSFNPFNAVTNLVGSVFLKVTNSSAPTTTRSKSQNSLKQPYNENHKKFDQQLIYCNDLIKNICPIEHVECYESDQTTRYVKIPYLAPHNAGFTSHSKSIGDFQSIGQVGNTSILLYQAETSFGKLPYIVLQTPVPISCYVNNHKEVTPLEYDHMSVSMAQIPINVFAAEQFAESVQSVFNEKKSKSFQMGEDVFSVHYDGSDKTSPLDKITIYCLLPIVSGLLPSSATFTSQEFNDLHQLLTPQVKNFLTDTKKKTRAIQLMQLQEISTSDLKKQRIKTLSAKILKTQEAIEQSRNERSGGSSSPRSVFYYKFG